MKKAIQLIMLALLSFTMAACGGGGSSSAASTSSCNGGSSASSGSAAITQLSWVTTVAGSGPVAAAGETLTVNYTGWLYNQGSTPNNEGAQFGTSVGGTPFSFVLGAGQVIAGWDQGLVGAQAGETRILTIPSALAYGSCAQVGSGIPPNSALVFSVSIISL